MDYFPLGLAEGTAFCNRVEERSKLKTNISLNRSTVVMSPRRYGKSSLVLYVLNELEIPYARVDMFVTIDETTVAREIIDGVNNLINKIISKPEQLITSMKDILKSVNTKWSVGTDGAKVELTQKSQSEDALTIRDVLVILDQVLERKKKKAVFFIDEFQEIGVVASAKGIEGAIRSVAEKSKNLIFIFSGSNRHLLQTMFEDRSRPLYMLCDKISLGRISENDYVKFTNRISEKKWGKPLSKPFFDELFTVTELHPYYINLICGRLYATHNKLPTKSEVGKIWQSYLLEEKSNTAIELSKLSPVQKKVLIEIAQGFQTNLTSKDKLMSMSTTSAAVIKAINILVKKDYIFELSASMYQIVDPRIRASICAFFPVAHEMR